MHSIRAVVLACLLPVLLSGCYAHRPWIQRDAPGLAETANPVPPSLETAPVHSLFLIGDAGAWPKSEGPVTALAKQLANVPDAQATVVFLGDNIYPSGLPPQGVSQRAEAEAVLANQLLALQNFKGQLFYIPGNHDWNEGRADGLTWIRRQDDWFDAQREGNVLRPDKGCPGPEVLRLAPGLVLLLLDTQWWLEQYMHPKGINKGCEVDDMAEWLEAIEAALMLYQDETVVVAGHHPLYSNGEHGGHFIWHKHLFPLREINKALWLPVPVLGSLYPLYRSTSGDIQDIPHPHYQAMRDALTGLFKDHPHLVYACGHEHNLQFHEKDGVRYLVSGSGAKMTPARKGLGATFAYGGKGFARLDLLADGRSRVAFFAHDADPGDSLLYAEMLPAPPQASFGMERPQLADSTVRVAAGPDYGASRVKGWFFGQHYRQAWTTPIDVPVLDLATEHGGLTPLRQGGGQQTLSMRLAAGDGNTYVLRSVNKNPAKALPASLRNTIAADVVQDQISSAHPYGALVVPILGEAAGVLHKKPSLRYVPNDPLLGPYRNRFADQLMLKEERADKDLEAFENLGGAKKAVSTFDMLDMLQEDNDNKVDEAYFLRHRLFDMFLGDWDRHEDQWRWARFKNDDDGYTYQPIPRDRDQVFARFDGLFPWIAGRKWMVRKFQHFDHDVRDIAGLNFNARYLDRTVLVGAERQVWLAEAAILQEALTDSVIRAAVSVWPDTIFALDGEKTIAILQSRRDKLHEFAERYYRVLAREVEVVGSDQEEIFEVDRAADGSTRVRVYNKKNGGKKGRKLYDRTFIPGETKEIRLFGRDGRDEFNIDGDAGRAIRVRVIGGEGKDDIKDKSRVAGLSRRTVLYDKRKGTDVDQKGELRDRRRKGNSVNEYNRQAFQYDVLAPVLSLGYNPDDGVFLGGGIMRRKYGFRKDPYQVQHRVFANIAPATGAYNARYALDLPAIWRYWGLSAEAGIQGPDARSSFYGFGNETEPDEGLASNFYRMRFDRIFAAPRFEGRLGSFWRLALGPELEYLNIEEEDNRFISSEAAGLDAGELAGYTLLGASARLRYDKVIGGVAPEKGVALIADAGWHQSVTGFDRQFTRLAGEFRFYIPLFRSIIWANRVGGTWLGGDPDVLHLANLGSTAANQDGGVLRGLVRDRYSGTARVYVNSELRLRLSSFQSSLVSGDWGVLGFLDQGRVWVKGMDEDAWHLGYGGGVWVNAASAAVITVSYARSAEGGQFLGGIGFPF